MFKRGQAQQFNWIFVVVVGAIILLFFLGFLMKYIDLQESKQNAEIARSFSNSILSSRGTEQYKNFSVSKPFQVDYDCENLIINKDQKFRIPYVLVTEGFYDNNLIFWVEEYNKGFLVDRVVFITEADKKYYFEDKYLVNLPPAVQVSNSIQDADVVVSSSPINQEGKKNIYVDEINKKITFVDENIEFDLDSEFFVYVAAFSNPDVFSCTKDKLDSKFDRLRELYQYKIQQISIGQSCSYSSISQALDFGDVENIIEMNNGLANLGCEVVF